MQFSIRLRSGPLPRFSRAPICTRRVFDSYRLRTETWGLEVQFDRESSVCEDSFMLSGDVGRASSPSITLCDAYSAIGDGGNSSPSLFVRELVSSMASLVAHAVMKHCRYSDCLCDVLNSFMLSGDVGRASSPSITLCDAYSAIGDGGNSSPSLFVRELVSSMASLVAHAVMKHCRYSDCLCDVLSKSQGRTRKNFSCIVKTLVDAFIVVARDLVGTRLEVIEMHVFGVQLG
ncbi:hypothetical protein HID58_066355 [Brassica napus]|uniref:Uncharacterized protein n=1 Tax=Brassica napus TaxID=3708 RepID=A0ABQ7ZFX0_BRANA|nr:hypothetical protein HID58_066355 [Brassica napus]